MTRRFATLLSAAAIAAGIAGAPIAAADPNSDPNQPRSRVPPRERPPPCARRREMSRLTTPLRRCPSIRTAASPVCSEREMDDCADNTQTHRSGARGSCSRGGYRQCAGGSRRRTGRNGPAVPAQSVLRAMGAAEYKCESPGNAQLNDAPPVTNFFPQGDD